MNNKGIKKYRAYIAVGIIFVVSIVALIILLEGTKKSLEPAVLSTTTTKSKNPNESQEEIEAKPFTVSLNHIIYGHEFRNNYKVSINYRNALFDFNCNKFNDETSTCEEGSGLMRYNDLILPLYTYNGVDNNYLNFADDYYIDITDNYIFLTMNHVGVKSGKTLIYSKEGNLIGEVDKIVTGYKKGGTITKTLYPNFSENRLSFYYEDHNQIKIGTIDIEDPKRKNQIEIVEGATVI